MKIKLSQGKFALVNFSDYAMVARRKWYAAKSERGTFYAISWDKETNSHIKMHRFILGLPNGRKHIVDHINHDTLDNRRINLRVGTMQQNNFNAKKRKGLWPYKGIAYDPRGDYFYARIRFNGKLYHLGTFEKMGDAAQAYNKAASYYFGEYACPNKITYPNRIKSLHG